ncbi:MAG: hypothetical protein A3H79_03035 [Candidatus Levybacteria bacterium RIFCSPLOWO2_02_FULL_36_8b]|nr:MAG: hypothetical protein A3H79_03035 [Candidatus Levybacteria bacterium RIFCSPLOWO2_02_FULL_36_8b]
MKILGTGLDGLVGSRIVELLKNSYEFECSDVDITDKDLISEKVIKSDAEIILHMAAKTYVDGCEEDKDEDIRISSYQNIDEKEKAWIEKKTAWAVNVFGTQNIVDACKKSNKKIIYISTDFVFDGDNCPDDGYDEESVPSPINWYSKTKYEGEKIVQNSGVQWIIGRTAYPYRSNFAREDFARRLIDAFRNGKELKMVTDHIMSPTFIDDIAVALDILISKKQTGIFHITGNQFVSPYKAALLIAEEFELDKSLIVETTRDEYFKGKAKRPFQLALKNDKIEKLGVQMRTFKEGLSEVRRQISL